MGSKGQSTQQQTQQQTYAPAGAGYVTNALNQAQGAASLPFNIPQAPVAGFSQDQQNAFGLVNQAQGQAQPYYNQAANYFSPQGTQQFLNPYVDQVTANMNDIFGQQQAQTTGQLTQAAGGVGADRIAVGQADLAKQQGLAAGQTYSSLYNNAAQQAQAAGYGTANLGQASQNSALQGAQALLGTGGLQQQLSQAQLNSPYQQQLAQAAFPYQQAQFLAGITGALAPGLGGTTSGQSNTVSQAAQPSIWSQLLGAGTAAAGVYGGLSGKGSTGGTGKGATSMNGQLTTPQSVPGYVSAARGGAINPFAEGGDVSDDPIDVSKAFSIPTSQITPIQAHAPQLNFSQPQQQSSSSGGKGGGVGLGDIAKVAMMFANRGGAVDPFNAATGYADGGAPDDDTSPATFDERFPFRMAGTEATDRWRASVDRDNADTLPPVITAGTNAPTPQPRPAGAMAFAGPQDDATLPANAEPTAGKGNPYSPSPAPAAADVATDDAGQSFAKSPWAALTAAGLGIMGGSSPWAGVNIGQGAQQGLKTLETQRTDAQKDTTIAQSAKRLEQEAKFHEDQFNRETVGQKNQREQADRPYSELTKYQQSQVDRQADQDKLAEDRFNRPYNELTKMEQAQIEEQRRAHDLARVPQGYRAGKDGGLEPIPGGPASPDQIRAAADAKRLPAMGREDMAPLVDAYLAGDHSVMNGVGRGAQGPQNIQQFWNMISERLTAQGADGRQIAASKANFMAQSAGLRVSAQREANIETAVNEAKGTFPQVIKTSEALPRTNFPLANSAIEAYRTNTGSPEQRKYGAAIQAAVTAYSQAMSRTGGNSVYAQQHAAEVINSRDGHEGLKASIEQLQTEMAIAQHAPEETRRAILDRILGMGPKDGAAPPAGGAPAAAPAAPAIPDAAKSQLKEGQVTTFGNGQKWTLKNGQPAQVP